MKVLLFPVKIYPVEVFTRATLGSSLVLNKTTPKFLLPYFPIAMCPILLTFKDIGFMPSSTLHYSFFRLQVLCDLKPYPTAYNYLKFPIHF